MDYQTQITVANKYKHVATPNDILVMRGTSLGNPFPMQEKTPSERARIINAFRLYLWHEFDKQYSEAIIELYRIAKLVKDGQSVNLICCCKPLPCHADVIKPAILWILNDPDFDKIAEKQQVFQLR